MSQFFGFSCIVAVCCAPCVVYAQSSAVTDVPGLALRIEAPRTQVSPTHDATASHTRIDNSTLTKPGATPAETLEYVPGVHGLETGPGAGNYSTFFIRGATASQSQVFLGDVPLGRSGRPLDPQALPFPIIDHIDIYRSVTPLSLGSNSMGGAIVLHPVVASHREVRAGGGVGSFRSAEASASYAEAGSSTSHYIGARIQGSKGNFTYADDRGTAFDTTDDRSATRSNNWQESLSAIDTLNYQANVRHKFSLLNYVHLNRGGLPGSGVHQARAAQRASLQQILGLTYRTKVGSTAIHARVYEEFVLDQQQDPLQEFGLWPNDSDNRTTVFGTALDTVIPAASWLDIAASALYERERYAPFDRLARAQQPTSLRHNTTLGTQLPIRLWQARLQLVPTFQWQYSLSHIAQEDAANPVKGFADTGYSLPLARLGLLMRAAEGLELLSNLARGSRLPSFVELFGDGAQLIPSTNLHPESSLTMDLGLRYRGSNIHHSARAEFAAFISSQKGTISYVRATRDSWVAQNMDGATLRGLEIGGSSTHWSHLRTQVAATLLDARLQSTKPYYADKQLPLRPPLTVVAQATVYHQSRRAGTFELTPAINYQSANFLDPSNRIIVPARAVWNAEMGWHGFDDRIAIRATVRNLTDRSFFDYAYYPLPGRNYYLTVEIRPI